MDKLTSNIDKQEISSDWRSQVADAKNFDMKTEYDYKKLINHFEIVKANIDNINPFEFLAGTYDLMKAFMKLGSALSTGFSDISTKVERWREIIIKEHKEKELNDLQSIMEKEISLKLHMCNGDNNSSQGFKKKSGFNKYVSGTRTLLRLNWFLHFVSQSLKNMANTTDSFSSCLKKAYLQVLAPHHSWVVKQSVTIAMSFAGSSKDPAMRAFFGMIFLINFV
jgi:hypothetical protein